LIKQTTQPITRTHRSTRCLPLLWLMLFSLLPASALAVPTLWQWSHPFPHGNQHNSVTTGKDINGNDQFIAVGVGGNIVTSRYGAFSPPWKLQKSTTSLDLNDIVWNGIRYVSVGDQGVIVISDDSEKWTLRPSGTDYKLTNVIWVNKSPAKDSFFLAIGEYTAAIDHPINGAINRPAAVTLTSSGGSTWALHNAVLNPDRFTDIPPPRLNGVTWDGTRFVASSDSGAILTSDDGIAWHTRSINSIVWNGVDLFLAVGDNGLALTSPDGTAWTYRETGVTESLFDAVWHSNSFIVVGKNGTALATNDGISWVPESTNSSETLHAISNLSGVFIAVGNNGTILRRSGSIWTPQTSGTTEDLHGVARSISKYVAVGNNGIVLFSNNDGTTWTAPPSSTFPLNFTTDLLGVSWGNNFYVATGKNGVLLTAGDDGASWSKQDSSLSGTSGEWLFDSIWDPVNSVYVMVGSNGTIITTTNITSNIAANWSLQTSNTSETLLSITTGGTSTLIGGEYATQITTTTPTNIVLTDMDMISEPSTTNVTSGRITSEHLNDILFANGIYTAVGNTGTILTSENFIHWLSPASPTSDDLFDITVDSENNNFLVSGAWGTLLSGTFTAPWPATSWSSLTSGTSDFLHGVASSPASPGSILVTAGSGGAIFTSNDNGGSWTPTAGPTQTLEDINSLVTSDSLMVAVGNSGVVLNSTDGGINWALQTSTPENPTPANACTSSHLHDVAWKSTAPTRFVAVGDAGAVCISNDGSDWNSITPATPPSTTSPLYSVVWGKAQFIAVGGIASSSTIYTSPDGDVWTLRNSAEPYTLRDIAWNGEHFFAVGDGGTILTSPQGITWVRNSSGTTADLHTVAFNDEMIVVTGTEPSPLATVILRNLDGTWEGANGAKLENLRINNLTFGGTQFAGVAPSGSVFVSSDAQEWQGVVTGTNTLFNAITWDGGKFIAAGAGGHILHATNPDLVITGGFLSEKVRDGEVARYRFTVTNRGLTTATNVSYSEELPSVSVFLSASSSRGSCTLATTLVCFLGDMATGETATITVDVTVTAIGTLLHTAEVTSDIEDNDLPNNTIVASIEIGRGNSDSGGASFSYWSLAGVLLFLLITNLVSVRNREPFVI